MHEQFLRLHLHMFYHRNVIPMASSLQLFEFLLIDLQNLYCRIVVHSKKFQMDPFHYGHE
jgi:hypothetical protein